MEWLISQEAVEYEQAIAFMEARVNDIILGVKPELIWCLEHPPLYSFGSSAKQSDLLTKAQLPIYYSGRGGKITYHGPGQRIIYVMLDLKRQNYYPDLRRFIKNLEQWVINCLAKLSIKAERLDGKVGIWVNQNKSYAKIAAIGIRLRKWVSFHGIAININPDLAYYNAIIPCGIRELGVTSMAKLGVQCKLQKFDEIIQNEFKEFFLIT